jgi:hypothetical protein
VVLVRTDVSEEPGASIIRVTKIGELGTTQAATSNRRTLRINTVFLCSHVNLKYLFPYETLLLFKSQEIIVCNVPEHKMILNKKAKSF